MANTNDKRMMKDIARRRVFLFFSIFVLVGLFGTVFEESDIMLHAVDDIAVVSLGFIGIVYLALTWRKTLPNVQNNVLTVLFAIALLFKIFAVAVEMGDPQDLGDDIPVLILTVIAIANRFT